MRSPEQYHEGEHLGAFEECRRCRRQAGHCRQKIRFTDWLEAQEWVTEYHESRSYALPWQYRYRCRWCEGYHTATIRGRDRVARDRVEKQRRKWLIERGERRGNP
jgi:hypothetical protein